MSTLAGDFWVCGECRSINNAGAKQCYNCRTPRDRAAVDPASIDPTGHGPIRRIELPEFTSSRWAAVLASMLILAVAAIQVVQFNMVAALLDQVLDGTAATEEQLLVVGSVGILAFGVALLALIAWSLWLSRTVTSMPALGLGYPAASGLMAFVENFIPVFNLFRVPAIARDVVRRLDPAAGRGEALIFAAWIGLLGGFLVPRILGLFTTNVRTLITISGIGTGLVIVGAIFLVVLIWWVEGRITKRRAAQLAEIGGVPVAPTVSPTDTGAEPDLVQTRSAFAAAAGATLTRVGDQTTLEPAAMSTGPAGSSDVPVALTATADAPEPDATTSGAAMPAPGSPAEPGSPTEPRSPTQPASASAPEAPSQPASPTGPVAAAVDPSNGTPHVVIRINERGLMTAEMDGETEHVILDDLGSYGSALAKVGGTAAIVLPPDDAMAGLIARRAQQIFEDAGVQVTFG